MGIEQAREHLKRYGREADIIEFDVSSATVELAAAALGCEPKLIAKSLSFGHADGPVLIVAAGHARIDNKKYRARFGAKASMLPADQVNAKIGHPVGGVCPFGVKPEVQIFLDVSLKDFEYFYPACGSPNSAIRMTCSDLEALCPGAQWVDVSRIPEAQSREQASVQTPSSSQSH